jgi:hypothetical protein
MVKWDQTTSRRTADGSRGNKTPQYLQRLLLALSTMYGSKYLKTLGTVINRQNWFYSVARQALGAVLPQKILALIAVRQTALSVSMRRFLVF